MRIRQLLPQDATVTPPNVTVTPPNGSTEKNPYLIEDATVTPPNRPRMPQLLPQPPPGHFFDSRSRGVANGFGEEIK